MADKKKTNNAKKTNNSGNSKQKQIKIERTEIIRWVVGFVAFFIILTFIPALGTYTVTDMLGGGKVLQFSTPDEIIHNPQDKFVEEFILRQLIIKRNSILKLFGESRDNLEAVV